MSHNFDDFIKGKFEQREFEFKDEYWDNALDLIRIDEKKQFRKRVAFYTLGAVLLLTIGLSSYFLGLNAADKQELTQENQNLHTTFKNLTQNEIKESSPNILNESIQTKEINQNLSLIHI